MRTFNLKKKITQVNILDMYILDSWKILSQVFDHYLTSGKRKKKYHFNTLVSLQHFLGGNNQVTYWFIFFQLPWSCKHITTRDAPFGLNSYLKFKYKICKYSAASQRTILSTKHFYFSYTKLCSTKKHNYCSINCGIITIVLLLAIFFHIN